MFNLEFFRINLISFLTLIKKEIVRVLRIWPQTILPSIITTILYFFVFGDLIGKKIGFMSGYNYIQYIVPGLIMMFVITSSYSNVVSSFFGSKFQRNIEELLISPTYNAIILCGFIFGGLVRSFLICFLIFVIAFFFSRFYFYDILIIICIYFLTAVLFSLFGLLNGIFARKFDDISIIPTFILTPLVYLGGIFYSVDLLPSNIQFFLFLNPIFYIVNIFRYGILGISEINIYLSFFVMCFFIIILYILCLFLLRFGYEIKK